MDTHEWTYGVELEWPDADNQAPLWDAWVWSSTDYTIVNSDGIAIDPLRRLVLRGGELNSPAYTSVDHLAEDVRRMWAYLQPGFNYRSNLHVHVRIPWLEQDVEALKQISHYTRVHLPLLWPQVDPLAGLLNGIVDPNEYAGALARLRHSERMRHFFIPAVRHTARMRAPTVAEALAAEVPRGWSGKPLWGLTPREAVNLRSLRKHGTVEFRCFAAPQTPAEVLAAAGFARAWLLAALCRTDPADLVSLYGPSLPRQTPYDHRLEVGWQRTNVRHNGRSVLAERIAKAVATS